jgi:3-oxoacyl-[acyl-carrier protein] reductase
MTRGLAVVTGGATGIGAASARALSRAGFRVAVHHCTSGAAAAALCAELGEAMPVQADLSTEEGVEALARAVAAQPLPLAVLVNNAGCTVDAPLFSAKLEDLDRVVALNLRGTWLTTKRLARAMARKKQGRVINISSVVASTGNAYQSVYGMTKAAIENLTRTLAIELAPFGILVNAVAPGFIDTAMSARIPDETRAQLLARVPLGRMGTPDEVAELVEFLATRGGYCTGAVFHVNGGLYGG